MLLIRNNKGITGLAVAGLIAVIYLLLNTGSASAALGIDGQLFYQGGTLNVQNEFASSNNANYIYLQTPSGPDQFLFIDNGNQLKTFNSAQMLGFGFVPGAELIFYIRVNNSTSPNARFFTGPASRNNDNFSHANITDLGGGTFRVGFEDIFGGGDQDFNDARFRVLDGGGPDPTVPIVADANGPYTIDEGDPVTLDASASTGTSLAYRWDVDGDGDFDENVSGVNPTVSAAALLALGLGDGQDTSNVKVEVTEQFLFWDFENTPAGPIATSVGLATSPAVTGFVSQTTGTPVETFGGGAGKVLITRFVRADNLPGGNRPFIQFTNTVSIQLEGLEFQHFHNHNPNFPTFGSYDVQLQLDSGIGFSDIGAPLTLNNGNTATTSTISLGSVVLAAGTHQIRWDARNLIPGVPPALRGDGTDTNTEFFALNDMTLFGRTATDTALLTVDNVPPAVTVANATVSVNVGQIANNSGTYSDPSTGDDVAISTFPVGTVSKTGVNNGNWNWTFDTTGSPLGSQTVTIFADDLDNGTTPATFILIITNSDPIIDTDNDDIAVDEGDTALNTGTYSDSVGQNVAISASVGTVVKSGTNSGTWNWSFGTTDGPAESQTVTITADDGLGGISDVTFELTVNNVAPSDVTLTAVSDNINENDFATVNGTFTDPGVPDSHTVEISWGDGSPNTVIALAAGVLAFSASHQYLDDDPTATLADDYVVKIESLTDSDGAEAGIGGDIFLTGHDPDFHAQGEAGAKNLLDVGLSFATGGTHDDGNNPNTKFLWVESRIAPPSGHLIGENGLIAIGLALGVDYDRANAAELPAVNFSNYTAIAVASAFGGLLTRAELDALIARKADIQNYINNGGGLFASAECDGSFGSCGVNLLGTSPDLYGYLPVNVSPIFAALPYTETAFGLSLGLVNSDLQSPTHNSFADASGLNIVDNDSAGNPTTLAGHVLVGEDALTEGLIITVNNLDPTASVTSASINEGGTATLTVTFSDVGTLDTHEASVDWGEGTVVALGAVTSPINVSHTYGDNGSFTVTVTVTDDDGGSAAPEGTVGVANLDPSLTLDTTGTITVLGSEFFTGVIDLPQTHSASANDPGSDDLTFDWSFAPDATVASNTYFNNGASPEPVTPSPDGVFPFGASDSASVTFAVPGVYTVEVTATDDDGGTATDSLDKLVLDICDCTKSQGFWKHQFSGKGKGNKIDEATLTAYLSVVGQLSGVFDEIAPASTIAEANNILNPKKGNNGSGSGTGNNRPSQGSRSGSGTRRGSGEDDDSGTGIAKSREKATAQTLAAWLNFAKGAIDIDELVDTDGDGVVDTSFGDLIAEVESILTNPDATKDDLERAKDLAESVNKHDKDNPECDTGTGSGAGSKADTRKGSKSGTGKASKSGTGKGSKAGTK